MSFALVRLALGAPFYGVMAYASGGVFLLLLQLAFSGGFLLLLAGEATRVRIAAGSGLVGLSMLMGACR